MTGSASVRMRSDQNLLVYRRLREAIVSGRFQPNERLVEADLAALLQVGRSPIRAALIRLDQEGLVVREPHRGARVRLVSDAEALEITEVRAWLERLIARCAAERGNEQDRKELRGLVEEMRRLCTAGDLLGYSELNGIFHQRLVAAARHPTAAGLLSTLKSHGIRFQYRMILQPGRPQRSLNEHEAILGAVEAGDPDAAERAMAAHMEGIVDAVRLAIAKSHASGREEDVR
jgi:DNA-binding GntR family transcriptional regulator